jgi:hypothetical protein
MPEYGSGRPADAVLRRWRPTAWPQSPFLDLQQGPSGQSSSAAHDKSLQDAAKGTRKLASFFRGDAVGGATGGGTADTAVNI